jgi:hypothetical protein
MSEPVIAGTRRSMKELVDGTLRVQIDIDREHRKRFLDLFSDIDMPVALVPLRPGFEQPPPEKGKLGPLAMSAVQRCNEPLFQRFVVDMRGHSSELPTEEGAAKYIRERCKVSSRRDLDTSDGARERFGALMADFREWQARR